MHSCRASQDFCIKGKCRRVKDCRSEPPEISFGGKASHDSEPALIPGTARSAPVSPQNKPLTQTLHARVPCGFQGEHQTTLPKPQVLWESRLCFSCEFYYPHVVIKLA